MRTVGPFLQIGVPFKGCFKGVGADVRRDRVAIIMGIMRKVDPSRGLSDLWQNLCGRFQTSGALK